MTVARSLVFATDALEPLGALTAAAQTSGLTRVWTTDLPGRDALTRAAFLSAHASGIGIGTGITYAFGRAPQSLAAAAADVQRLTGGRFILGLGTGTSGLRARWGVDFEPPAPRLAQMVGALRTAWDTEALADPPPIAGAGLGEAMLRSVGATCDRVLLAPLCLLREHLDDRALPAISAGAERRSAPGTPAICAWCIAAIDADGERARAQARELIAFYLTRSDYSAMLAQTRWGSLAQRLRDAATSNPAGNAALIPDELVDELSISGTPEQAASAAARLELELAARGIDELVLQVPGMACDAAQYEAHVRRAIAALAPPGDALA